MNIWKDLQQRYLLGYGKESTLPTNITIVQIADEKYVLVNCTGEQLFSLDQLELMTKEELYTFVNNAQRATTMAAKIYKLKNETR